MKFTKEVLCIRRKLQTNKSTTCKYFIFVISLGELSLRFHSFLRLYVIFSQATATTESAAVAVTAQIHFPQIKHFLNVIGCAARFFFSLLFSIVSPLINFFFSRSNWITFPQRKMSSLLVAQSTHIVFVFFLTAIASPALGIRAIHRNVCEKNYLIVNR